MEKIGLDEARQLLARAVETQGRDFVYETKPQTFCVNVPFTDDLCPRTAKIGPDHPKRKTGCLVGTAMSLSGRISPEDMRAQYAKGSVGWAFGKFLTDQAGKYFSTAQNVQDQGATWGEAFDRAEEYAEVVLPKYSGVGV